MRVIDDAYEAIKTFSLKIVHFQSIWLNSHGELCIPRINASYVWRRRKSFRGKEKFHRWESSFINIIMQTERFLSNSLRRVSRLWWWNILNRLITLNFKRMTNTFFFYFYTHRNHIHTFQVSHRVTYDFFLERCKMCGNILMSHCRTSVRENRRNNQVPTCLDQNRKVNISRYQQKWWLHSITFVVRDSVNEANFFFMIKRAF